MSNSIKVEQQIMFIGTLYVIADIDDNNSVYLHPVNNPAKAGRFIAGEELEIQLENNPWVYLAENILNTANGISVCSELKTLQKVQRLTTLADFAHKQQKQHKGVNHILFAQRTDHLVRIDRKIEILKAQYKNRPKARKVGMSPALSAPFNNTPTLRATYQDSTQLMAEHKPTKLQEIDLDDHTTWTLQPI